MTRVRITDVAPLAADRVTSFSGTRPFIATGSLDDGGAMLPESVTFDSRPSRADVTIRDGDVCFARMQGTGKVFKFELDDENLILSTGFAVLRPTPASLYSRFLYHFLRTPEFQKTKDRLCSGATQKAITNEKIESLTIPLPSLAAQLRIAEVLDQAETLRAKRQTTIAQLVKLTEILFLDMFGDPAINPKGWPKEKMGQVARFRQGLQVSLEDQFDTDSPVRSKFLRIVNYTQNSNEFRYIAKQPESRHVQPDDIVVVRYGATAGFVGRGQYGVIANNLFTVEVDETVGTKTFVYHLLRQPRIYELLLEGRKAAAMPAINFSGMEKLPFILPPLALQREFARRVTAVEKLKTAQRASLAELDALFATLQHRAFGGEL